VKSRTNVMTILGMIDKKHLPSHNRAAAGITPQPRNPNGRPSLPNTCLPCIAPAHCGLLRRRCASCAAAALLAPVSCTSYSLDAGRNCSSHSREAALHMHRSGVIDIVLYIQRNSDSDSILDLWLLTSYALTDLIITTRVAGFNKAL